MLFVVFISVFVSVIQGHPQCLDFQPPFEPQFNFSLCSEYQSFGCCNNDTDIALRFVNIANSLNRTDLARCQSYIKSILCQKCSPYAAHLYFAETTLKPSSFPSLCTNYYQNFSRNCGSFLPLLTSEPVKAPDENNCYPDTLTENENLGQVNVGDNCRTLCVRKVIRNLFSPTAGKSANDGTHRPVGRPFTSDLPKMVAMFKTISTGNDDNCEVIQNTSSSLGLRWRLLRWHIFMNKMAVAFLYPGVTNRGPLQIAVRMFIVEQRGVVWVYLSDFSKLSPPFIDIRTSVYETGRRSEERGLLDIAFHPNFKTNKLFYLYYTRLSNGRHVVRVSEFKVYDSDMNRAEVSSERRIIEIPQVAANHNGGSLFFREGLLYIFTGDGGLANDPQGHGQNRNSLLGKVLRINVDIYTNNRPYSIPNDNPFVGETGVRHEIYAYGLRNPWKCSLDTGDGKKGNDTERIFCGDVGQNRIEEIDIINSGANYGWNGYEGTSCFQNRCSFVVNHTPPIFEYTHNVGRSVTGGNVYRGCESPNLKGKYIFGDWSNGRLFYLEYQNNGWIKRNICMGSKDGICVNGGLTNSYDRYINAFGHDELGEVYLLVTSNPISRSRAASVYQLVDPSRRGNPSDCQGKITTEVVIQNTTRVIPPYVPPDNSNKPRTTTATTTTATTPTARIRARIINRRTFSSTSTIRYGIVQVRRGNANWGLVCESQWDRADANALCMQLNYRGGTRIAYREIFGSSQGTYHMSRVQCSDGVNNLAKCSYAWGKFTCSNPATVYCWGGRPTQGG